MNTPKLISILSSPALSPDAARAGRVADPAHGLDFSQLLGERRSQGASAFDSASARRDSGRSATQTSSADRQSQRNTPAARDNTPASRNTASSSSRADSPRAERNVASSNRDTRAQNTQQGTQPSKATGNPATHQGSSAPAANADASTGQTDTELAQNAAESGQVLMTAQTAAPLLPVSADAENAPGQRPALLATNLLASAAQQEPATAQPGTTPAGPHPLSVTAPADDTADALVRPAVAQQAGAGLINPAAQTPVASAPGAAPAFAGASESPIAMAVQAALAEAPADTPHNAPTTALQDFTAMVQAARATTGAAVPVTAQGLPASASAAVTTALPVTAMPVGGLLPGQNPLQPLSTVPGITAPLSSPQWSTEFGRQFISIAQASNGLGQVAELRLDPPELGPLRITINLNDSVAHAVISSPHAAVRQSVENALPQLQQMLEQAGISLGQANVNDQHQQGNGSQGAAHNGRQPAGTAGQSNDATLADGSDIPRSQRPADPNALVDTFA